MKTSRDSPKSRKKVLTPEIRKAENVPSGMQIKEGVDHKVIEHLTSLPTVFEGKTAEKTRKFSTREHWSNIGNLRKFGSLNDVRAESIQPLSPFLTRYSSPEDLQDETPSGVRNSNRKISSPFPTHNFMSPVFGRKRRTLSESPAEALISPVITRRSFGIQPLNKRVFSCPLISTDLNERVRSVIPSSPVSPRHKTADVNSLKCSETQSGTKLGMASFGGSSDFTSTEPEKLPRISQTRSSSMLVRVHQTPTESARDRFNVSPVMGQSADAFNNNNSQCDVTDKVQYFLHTLSLEEDIDQ